MDIGETIVIDGVKVRAEADDGFGCANCVGSGHCPLCLHLPDCSGTFRDDGRDIIFKKVEE